MKEFIYVSAIGRGYKGHVLGFVLLGKTGLQRIHVRTQRGMGAAFPSPLFMSSYHPPLCQSHLSALSGPNRTISSRALTPFEFSTINLMGSAQLPIGECPLSQAQAPVQSAVVLVFRDNWSSETGSTSLFSTSHSLLEMRAL